jgi:hypothetical protein
MEFLGTVSTSSTYTQQFAFALNPGLASVFPWLSTQAASWEHYRFHSVRIKYVPFCATSTAGSLIMVPDYDSGDVGPVNEGIALSYTGLVENVVWDRLIMNLDTRAMNTTGSRKFVRTGPLAINQDIKLSDSGNVYVYTNNASGTATCGKLFIEYDVELMNAQLPPTGLNTGGSIGQQTPGGLANIYGNTPMVVGPFTVNTANTLTFLNSGSYLVTVFFVGTGATSTAPTTTGSTATITYINANQYVNSTTTGETQLVITAVAGQTFVLGGMSSSWTTISETLIRIGVYNTQGA